MLLPFRRDRLAERAALDAASEAELCGSESPGDRLALSAGLSDLARRLGKAVQAEWVTAPAADLPQKALLWARPLRVLAVR